MRHNPAFQSFGKINMIKKSEISGFHGSEYEDDIFLEYSTV
jgi:hypothetical protein